MLLEDLIQRFNLERKYNPSHVNELLDFLQRCYINGKLSIVDYKKIFFELDKRQAEKPTFDFEKSLNHPKKVNIPV